MYFVLELIGGATHIITEEQKAQVEKSITNGTKAFYIGKNLVVTHQVSGVVDKNTYERNMKLKLSSKGLRMCRRCHLVMPRIEKCPCIDKPEKYINILDIARKENPKLDQLLSAAQSKMIASPK